MEHASAREALRGAVEEAARRLGRNPQRGSVRPYLPAQFRFWLLPRFGFVMVYDPDTNPVEVLRFVHTRRDLPRVLAELRDPAGPGGQS